MRRHVEPAGVEVEADGGGGCLAETLLPVDGIFARSSKSRRGRRPEAVMAETSGTRSARRAANSVVISAVVAPGSYSSSRAS